MDMGSVITILLRTSFKTLNLWPFKQLATKYNNVNNKDLKFEGKKLVAVRNDLNKSSYR